MDKLKEQLDKWAANCSAAINQANSNISQQEAQALREEGALLMIRKIVQWMETDGESDTDASASKSN